MAAELVLAEAELDPALELVDSTAELDLVLVLVDSMAAPELDQVVVDNTVEAEVVAAVDLEPSTALELSRNRKIGEVHLGKHAAESTLGVIRRLCTARHSHSLLRHRKSHCRLPESCKSPGLKRFDRIQ